MLGANCAVQRCYPGAKLKIEHSMSHGWYCRLSADVPVSDHVVSRLKEEMSLLCQRNFATDNFNICFKIPAVDFQRVRHILRYKGQILRKISVVTSEMESNTISASASISFLERVVAMPITLAPAAFPARRP